jgi:thiamine-phosphate pyrophosphorylase
VGQDDVSVAHCRDLLGANAIIGLSTHSDEEFNAALLQPASYFSAGPIEPTPTKLGRPGTGVNYAVDAQSRSDRPVFVTGGVTAENIGVLVDAGLRHFVVVRALCEAREPGVAARELRRALNLALA